ncbi:MAG: DUF58 domain-containing protein [Clostridiales bacterium]|nr:DUF58 domain-containing protein [Clostridiales bacterium]
MHKKTFWFAFAMATLLVTALSTGQEIYYLFFLLMLAMLVLSAVTVLWTALTLRVDIRGVKPRVTRGEALPLIITAKHACLLPAADVRMVMAMHDAAAGSNTITAFLPPFQKKEFRFVMRCAHRGEYVAGVSHAVISDVFGLIEIKKHIKRKTGKVEVLPRVRQQAELEIQAGDTGPESRSRAAEDASSPSGVRAWQDGDILKRVHWKLTMRKKELLVRTFEESAKPDTLILPDLTPVNALEEQALFIEDCVCEICLGAAQAQLLNNSPVNMPLTAAKPYEINGRSIVDVPRFQSELARVKFDSSYSYEQVLASMLSRMQRTGGAILVTPHLTMRIADAAIRMRQMGMEVSVFWVSDAQREEVLALTGRLRLAGIDAHVVNPWTAEESA